jgi:hypothetical protein
MSYTVTVFNKWVSDFSSWDALKSWLTSAEGGSLRVVEPRDSTVALVRYTKGTSKFDLEHVRWCRSVVVDKTTRLPLSVAPPKANDVTESSVTDATIAEEFVDGTMLNVFRAAGAAEESLATRSRIGGQGHFYDGGKTFQEMFKDALANNKMSALSQVLPQVDGAASVFTSTVLQHPENRIVRNVTAASFVLVHQGWTAADGTVHLNENPAEFRCVLDDGSDADFFEIQEYKLEPLRAAKTLKDWVNKQSQERGYGWQGVVLKDGKGKRWRVRSDQYETVRRIRGNESSVEERFARLRKARSIDQYMVFYPEDRDLFYSLEGRLRKNTRNLSHFYTDVFRARKTAYYELPWPYKHHVSVLHNLFKDTLRADKKKVDLEQVIKYVNSLNFEDMVNMLKEHNLTLRKETKPDAQVPSQEAPVAAE